MFIQNSDVRAWADFMIEITEFFKGKICRINIVVLEVINRSSERKDVFCSFSYFPTGQAEFFQDFKDTLLCFPRSKCLADAKSIEATKGYGIHSIRMTYLRTGIFLLTFSIKDNFNQLKRHSVRYADSWCSDTTHCLRKIVVGHILFALWLWVIFLIPSIQAWVRQINRYRVLDRSMLRLLLLSPYRHR